MKLFIYSLIDAAKLGLQVAICICTFAITCAFVVAGGVVIAKYFEGL